MVFDETDTDPHLRATHYSNYKKTILEGNIGDILYFDFNTIHSSEGNTKEGCRPIFIFEVEKIEGIPLEADGRNAITFNYQYPTSLKVFPKRVTKFVRNVIIFPMLKRILNILNKFGLLSRIVISK